MLIKSTCLASLSIAFALSLVGCGGGGGDVSNSVSSSSSSVASYMVTTLAGSGSPSFVDGTGTGASFNGSNGIGVDSAGNVYVADTSNHRIRKITPAGVVTTLAGSGSPSFVDGTGTGASFNYPTGVVVDSAGNVYVADNGNNRIRKISVSP